MVGMSEYVSIWTQFRLFLPQSNNLETVSILSKWVNTNLMDDRRFYLNTTPWKIFTTDAFVFK